MKTNATVQISWRQIVELVGNITICNNQFDIDDCCLRDVEILRGAANLIERELENRNDRRR